MPYPLRRQASFRKASRRARYAQPAATAPLPGAVINAILRFHDIEEDVGGGRTLMRLSKARCGEAEVRAELGDGAARAEGVGILWNEREGEIIRVLEGAGLRLAA